MSFGHSRVNVPCMRIDAQTPLCFVDLETTGLNARHDHIIEIGMVRDDRKGSVETFRTFIDPEVPIPAHITALTGIVQHDVVGAPLIGSVLARVARLLDGAILVAHNASFDYSFLAQAFLVWSRPFQYASLCTVQLSRSLYPHLRSHSADALIARFGLVPGARHRALDDALVLKQFFEHACTTFGTEQVLNRAETLIRAPIALHPLATKLVEQVPPTSGVYRLYGSDGELIHIGKSNNMHTRVHTLLSTVPSRDQQQLLRGTIGRVEYTETGGEIGAMLLADHLLATHCVDTQCRRDDALVAACVTPTKSGHLSIALSSVDTLSPGSEGAVVGVYATREDAEQDMVHHLHAHDLCPTLLDLEPTAPCSRYADKACHGACCGRERPRHYNVRFRRAFSHLQLHPWPYEGAIVLDEGSATASLQRFHIDHWRIIAAYSYTDDAWAPFAATTTRFSYAMYKVLVKVLLRQKQRPHIRVYVTGNAHEHTVSDHVAMRSDRAVPVERKQPTQRAWVTGVL